MNRYIFAIRNIMDKLPKVTRSWKTFKFYSQTYILSKFDFVKPNIYIVSYPKCGRTWLRFMLQKYFRLTNSFFKCFNDKSILGISKNKIIKFEHDQGSWIPVPLKIDQLSFNTPKYFDKKIVFLVRDPRDVLVSSWYHLKYREGIYQKDLSSFIRDDLMGVNKVIAFMNMWIGNRHIPSDFFLLTYEQMHDRPIFSFRKLLNFIEVNIKFKSLQKAIEESSFEKMKHLELEGVLNEPWMKPGKKNSRNSMKIRKGKVGEFYKELSKKDIEFLNHVIQNKLSPGLPYH